MVRFKIIYIACIVCCAPFILFASPVQAPVLLEDHSGFSEDEVRKVATQIDRNTHIDTDAQAHCKKLSWYDLSPTPQKYDWIQTKSGEWFKGKIKALYDDKLEFDSDEIGDYRFDFEDIVRIKSYHIYSVNIENLAVISGIIRLDGKIITIIQGDSKYTFSTDEVISLAPAAQIERNFWSGKITVSFDVREGNTQETNYSAQANLKRRTAQSNLSLDYLGRISSQNNTEIANDHRINEKYDIYLTRYFFFTPLFSEYYTDRYKNIKDQVTLGLGIGYTMIDTKDEEWSLSGGPALLYTHYNTVEAGSDTSDYSPALELSTRYEKKLSVITDFTFNGKFTLTDDDGGRYKHHMIFMFENELFSWLDFDITGVWDYVYKPQESSEHLIPKRDDYQFLIGFGIEF